MLTSAQVCRNPLNSSLLSSRFSGVISKGPGGNKGCFEKKRKKNAVCGPTLESKLEAFHYFTFNTNNRGNTLSFKNSCLMNESNESCNIIECITSFNPLNNPVNEISHFKDTGMKLSEINLSKVTLPLMSC